MPRLPTKLIVFVILFACFWIYLAPKRADLAMRILRKKRDAHSEETARFLIEEKIRGEICPASDLCEYRPAKWEGFYRPDTATSSLEHSFYADGKLRRYLFRIRNMKVTEIIDLR